MSLILPQICFKQIGLKPFNTSWINQNESYFELKLCLIYCFKRNNTLLMHSVVKGKTKHDKYYIQRCLKPFANEI